MRLPSRSLAAVAGHAALYALLGALSFATASVASNTAAVWIPTGYSLALLLARGRKLWPAVALGAFAVNLGSNLLSAGLPLPLASAVAAAVAIGNTGEALLGAWLARRFAGGAALLEKPIRVAAFAVLNATLPPLVSMGFGVAASRLGGIVSGAALREAMLTWYLADAVGILIVAAPCLALFTGVLTIPPPGRRIEAVALASLLVFVSPSMDGVVLAPALASWPRAYMLIPLLLWAAFRFRTCGALAAILLVGAVSVVGTMRGFEAFAAATPSRSLLSLQIFLGLLAVTVLAITASLTEIDLLRAGLDEALRNRAAEVERLVRARDLFSTLVVHDLQSPLYGLRNALRAAAGAIEGDRLAEGEAAAALRSMDDVCTGLAERIDGLLRTQRGDGDPGQPREETLHALVAHVAAAHGLGGETGRRLVLRFGTSDLVVKQPAEVGRIIDGLIANAVEHGPAGGAIEVCAYRHAGNLEILVADEGTIHQALLPLLFRPEMQGARAPRMRRGSGLGLHLAGEQARELGGRLTYCSGSAGSTFRLIVPG